jgi:hypothetical protein
MRAAAGGTGKLHLQLDKLFKRMSQQTNSTWGGLNPGEYTIFCCG